MASLTTASANGCSDSFSSEATYTNKLSLDIPASGNQKVIAENKNVITFSNFEEFKDKFLQLANLTEDTDECAFGIFK